MKQRLCCEAGGGCWKGCFARRRIRAAKQGRSRALVRAASADDGMAGGMQDVLTMLARMNVAADENVVLPELGYMLGIKLRDASTTIEIYGRSDCVDASGSRGPNVKPHG